MEESFETVSKGQIYNPNAIREKRAEYLFETGTTYTGEWKGNFRDGYGVQHWPDGADYEG